MSNGSESELIEPPTEAEMIKSVRDLSATVNGMRLEVEGWRQHSSSTGYFLQIAVEDLLKAVNELTVYIEARKKP